MAEELLQMYGEASMFASGMVVDGLHAYGDDLWMACSTALGNGLKLSEDASDLLKRDWARRLEKFANNYFGGDREKASFCLRDVYNLHKWAGIQNSIKDINFAETLSE
ncbi:hypothetical protein [Caballeronia sp. GAWG1-5s-s]|uniref:hypothetical protein n=1 Tax=Caballeronia sp. GAWG1-5s-s TaxID=2921743 RepID=UPI0020296E00|nr:hypothetical protein [Caballeronia sp. GAWG1-5s-s]